MRYSPGVFNLTGRSGRIENWLEHKKIAILIVLSAIYVAGTIGACSRPLWYDEFFTLEIARSANLDGILDSLRLGLDRTPPLYHYVNWFATRVFGLGLIGLRAVSIAGFWVGGVCLFLAVSNRFGTLCGSIAFMALTLTRAEYFASEARSYALSLGFCGVAILAWQYAVILRRKRPVALVVLGASLFLLVANFFLNVVVLLAFFLPEMYAWIKKRKMDWPLCVAVSMGVLSILVMAPLAAAVLNQSLQVWTSEVPSPGQILTYYLILSGSLGFGLLFIVCVASLRGLAGEDDNLEQTAEGPRAEEILFSSGFLVLPVLVLMGTYLVKTYGDARYTLPTTLGFAMVVAGLTWLFRRKYRSSTLIVAGALFALFVWQEAHRLHWSQQVIETGLGGLRAKNADQLVFINDPYSFMRVWHTWPEEDRKRVRYAYDMDLAAHYNHQTQLEFNMRALESRDPETIIPFTDLERSSAGFLLYYSPEDKGNGWLLKKLLEKGASLRLLGKVGEDLLFEVRRAGMAE
jgi:hypothetical protein